MIFFFFLLEFGSNIKVIHFHRFNPSLTYLMCWVENKGTKRHEERGMNRHCSRCMDNVKRKEYRIGDKMDEVPGKQKLLKIFYF